MKALPKRGRPVVQHLRANVTHRRRRVQGRDVESFDAYVRGARQARTYLRSYPVRAEALEACARFIATGEKPAPAARGPRGPQRKPRAKGPAKARAVTVPRLQCLPPPRALARLELLRRVYRERLSA